LIQALTVIPVEFDTVLQAAGIARAQRTRIPPLTRLDVVLAATAAIDGLTLVTHDVAHFANLPGLAVVEWLVP
jgi:predicted nucleic acid-binding protein